MKLLCPECGSIHITKVDDGQEDSTHTCEDCGFTSPLEHFTSGKDDIDDEFDDDDIAEEIDLSRPDDLWPEERDELEDD